MQVSAKASPTNALGVTLLELLVVISIVGLLLAITPPLLGGVLPRVAHEAAAREMVAALRQARTQSIARNHPTDLYVDVAEKQYWTSASPRHSVLPSNLEIALYADDSLARDADTGGIRFYPDGSSTGGRIVLSVQERSYRIDVDWLFGRVTLSE